MYTAKKTVILRTNFTLSNLTENELRVKYYTIIELPITYYCIGFTGSFTPHSKACYLLILCYEFYEKMTTDKKLQYFENPQLPLLLSGYREKIRLHLK